jgi:hypothetical protein
LLKYDLLADGTPRGRQERIKKRAHCPPAFTFEKASVTDAVVTLLVLKKRSVARGAYYHSKDISIQTAFWKQVIAARGNVCRGRLNLTHL